MTRLITLFALIALICPLQAEESEQGLSSGLVPGVP